MTDWKIFTGSEGPHDRLAQLPEPPPWRFSRAPTALVLPEAIDIDAEVRRAKPFIASHPMVTAVNSALYLRRPLLVTGRPGTGKSTLISKVAHELKLGRVLRWSINSRSSVRGGLYDYDAVGRLQAGSKEMPAVEDYLTLGPLGTALHAETWPRALLIDEIDKSDLDFANDLLNIIEEGAYEIPELRRLGVSNATVRDYDGNRRVVDGGRVQCRQFPFVVMTSNGEREFPAPFLRRCIRLDVVPPDRHEVTRIVEAHLRAHFSAFDRGDIDALINDFVDALSENKDVSTDQLLNAIFLTIAVPESEGRTFDDGELATLRSQLMRALSDQG